MKIKFREIIFRISSIFLCSIFFICFIQKTLHTLHKLIESKFINTQISYFIPVSCDLELYLTGVYDIGEIYKFDYNYQSRPLYILYIKVIYEVLGYYYLMSCFKVFNFFLCTLINYFTINKFIFYH